MCRLLNLQCHKCKTLIDTKADYCESISVGTICVGKTMNPRTSPGMTINSDSKIVLNLAYYLEELTSYVLCKKCTLDKNYAKYFAERVNSDLKPTFDISKHFELLR